MSSSLLSGNSRLNGGSTSSRTRSTGSTILSSGVGFNGRNRIGFDRFNRFGFNRFGFNRFNRFGFGGCWDCGFGFGFGFGWGTWGWGGWPWIGYWGWDPFWYDPWWGPGYGYGYYGYPNYGVYPDAGYSAPNDYSTPPAQQDYQDNQPNSNPDNQGQSNGNWVTPNGPSPSYSQNSGGLAVPILIYMKNGAVYSVRDYWMIDGELHYILINGVQKSVDLNLVDLPRTNAENAKSGVKFIFKSEPSVTPPASDEDPAPPAAPNSIEPNAPTPGQAPTKQLDAVPQPEART